MTSPVLHGTGRVLLALYFFVPGLMKISGWDDIVALVKHHGVAFPEVAVLVSIAVNVIGALLLMTNRHVRLTALGFALYILLVNFMLHDFWNFDGIEGAHELQNFIKNLGILAGLLVLAGASPIRPLRLSSLLQNDRNLE